MMLKALGCLLSTAYNKYEITLVQIKGSDNPADVVSRELTADDLVNESNWLNGPKFLWENKISFTGESFVEFDMNG